MTAIIIGLFGAALFAATVTTFLILLRIGIRHQEGSGSLKCRPKSLSAALTRRVLDLHTCPQPDPERRGPKDQAEGHHSARGE